MEVLEGVPVGVQVGEEVPVSWHVGEAVEVGEQLWVWENKDDKVRE